MVRVLSKNWVLALLVFAIMVFMVGCGCSSDKEERGLDKGRGGYLPMTWRDCSSYVMERKGYLDCVTRLTASEYVNSEHFKAYYGLPLDTTQKLIVACEKYDGYLQNSRKELEKRDVPK